MRLFLLDNYDSFTWNLVHLFSLSAEVTVVRSDQISVDEVISQDFDGLLLSPGPGRPDRAGIMSELIKESLGKVPILGVCLGHQALGEVLGATLEHAPIPIHGKCSTVLNTGRGLFKSLPPVIRVCRYHSLTLNRDLPSTLLVDVQTDDGVVMGISHRELPAWGLQFHPESFLTEGGNIIAKNFIDACRKARHAN